jgi:hypothetical protein
MSEYDLIRTWSSYMHTFRLSALSRFGNGLKVLSERLQVVRKLLHQRVLHSRRNPLRTEPSKPFVNAFILHQLFYLTDCDSCWLRKLWLQLTLRECKSDTFQTCFTFPGGSFRNSYNN